MELEENNSVGLIPTCLECGGKLVAVVATAILECISCDSQFNLLKIKPKKKKRYCVKQSSVYHNSFENLNFVSLMGRTVSIDDFV